MSPLPVSRYDDLSTGDFLTDHIVILCGGAERVIFCEAGMWEELFIVNGLPACRRSRTMETEVKVIHSALFVRWQI